MLIVTFNNIFHRYIKLGCVFAIKGKIKYTTLSENKNKVHSLWTFSFEVSIIRYYLPDMIHLFNITPNVFQGLELRFFAPLSTIFQLFCGGQFYWWRKRGTRRKPPTFRKLLTNFTKVSHNVVLSTPRHEWDSNSQLYSDSH